MSTNRCRAFISTLTQISFSLDTFNSWNNAFILSGTGKHTHTETIPYSMMLHNGRENRKRIANNPSEPSSENLANVLSGWWAPTSHGADPPTTEPQRPQAASLIASSFSFISLSYSAFLSLSLSLFLSFSLSSFSPYYSFLRLLLLFIVIIIIIFRPEENIQIYLHHSTRCHHATLFHRIRGAINPLIMKILFNLQEFIRIPHRCVPVRFGSFDVGLSRSLALCDFRYPLLISCIVDMILIKRMTISERKPAILTCWTHGK